MRMTKYSFVVLASICLIGAIGLTAVPAWAAEDKVPAINTAKGVALKGYDPVAYFETSAAVKGSADFEFTWMTVKWRFASARHRDLFAADPARYAPQFGGYCAWAVSQGYTADVDPLAWKVVGGKLYLNYNPSIQRKWEAGGASLIEAGERNWPRLNQGQAK